MSQDLGKIVDDESVAAGEHLASNNVNFPTGQIGVQTIDESGVVVLCWKCFEQIGVLQHVGYIVIGISDEGKTRLRPHRCDPA